MKPYYADDRVTIYHGDSLEIAEVFAFAAVVTDPPYGIDHDTNYTRFGSGDCKGTGLKDSNWCKRP